MEENIFERVESKNEIGCVGLALSIALDEDVNVVIADLKKYGDDPQSEKQWGQYLLDNGFHRVSIDPVPNQPRILLGKLTKIALPNQILVCKSTEHVVTIKNRKFYDYSDNRDMCIFWYYTK